MMVEVTVRIDEQKVATVRGEIREGSSLEVEEETRNLVQRVGAMILEVGLERVARNFRTPICCGRPMENRSGTLPARLSLRLPGGCRESLFRRWSRLVLEDPGTVLLKRDRHPRLVSRQRTSLGRRTTAVPGGERGETMG
jgi:hypothetical protein